MDQYFMLDFYYFHRKAMVLPKIMSWSIHLCGNYKKSTMRFRYSKIRKPWIVFPSYSDPNWLVGASVRWAIGGYPLDAEKPGRVL